MWLKPALPPTAPGQHQPPQTEPDGQGALENMYGEAIGQANLARFKLPREIVFTDSLPRNVMGKVQHFLLKERLSP